MVSLSDTAASARSIAPRGGPELFQVVGQSLTPLGEGRPEEPPEALPVLDGEQRGLSFVERDERRMDAGGRREGAGRQREVEAHPEIELEEDGQRGALLGAGPGRDALGHLLLKQEDAPGNRALLIEEFEQERRGNGVGQVARDLERMPRTGFPAEELAEVGLQDVLFQDDRVFRFLFQERRNESRVLFDGDEPAAPAGEREGQDALCRARLRRSAHPHGGR